MRIFKTILGCLAFLALGFHLKKIEEVGKNIEAARTLGRQKVRVLLDYAQ